MPPTGKLPKTDRVLDHTLKERGSQSPRASRRYFADDMVVMARLNGSVSDWTAAVSKLLPLASERR